MPQSRRSKGRAGRPNLRRWRTRGACRRTGDIVKQTRGLGARCARRHVACRVRLRIAYRRERRHRRTANQDRNARATQSARRRHARHPATPGRLSVITSIRRSGTMPRICSRTTARSRWGSTACTSARRACAITSTPSARADVGLGEGQLNEHLQVMPVITLAADGKTAKARWRGDCSARRLGGDAYWSEGPYENEYVERNGVWKIKSLHWYPALHVPYAGVGKRIPIRRVATASRTG